MIRYSLVCEAGHGFESWFPSSDSYDAQAARGLVTCPVCDTAKVAKALMAPSIARTDRAPAAPAAAQAPSAQAPSAQAPSAQAPSSPGPEAPVTLVAEPERRMRAMLRALRAHVEQNSEHVGARFPEEARRIHYGEAEGRSIHGQASPDEARALVEEGIDVAPLPFLADDRH